MKVQAARRRDHVSHFLLRLFCCRNEELRKWFIQHETEMLRFRLLDESSNVNLSEFLDYNNLIYERASEEYRTHLIKSNIINPPTMRKSNFELYCIPFEEALDLIRNRRVYVENGLCYVMPREMVYIICTRFRMELAQSLANLSNYLPQLEEENRLLPLFEAIYNEKIKNNRPTQNIENRNGLEQVTPDMVDQLALDHFPPCMRNMHDSLRAAHHLRHFGRLHYGLFLKSIGMRMEDALQFFREEFIQKVTPERFQREYAYNIRYNYGKEGKRVNMSAYSCAKILNENGPGPGDSHGCPFKHFDEANLVRMLRSHRIKEEAITEMVEMASQKNYTGSCSRYFSCKQPNYPLNEKGIFHPSQFYVESRKAARGIPSMVSEKEDDDETAKTNNGEELDEFDDDLDDQMFSELTEQDVGLMMQKNEDSGDSNPANLDQSSKEDSNQSVKKLKVDLLKMQQTEDVKNEESSETVDKSDSTLNLSKIKSTTTGESIGPEQENKKLPGVAEATIDVKNQSDGLTSASIFEQMDKKPIVDQVVKNTQFDHSETSTSIPMEE